MEGLTVPATPDGNAGATRRAPASASPAYGIQVHIDEIVLDGDVAGGPDGIALAVERELAHLAATRGLSGHRAGPTGIGAMEGTDDLLVEVGDLEAELSGDWTVQTVGAGIARAIFDGLEGRWHG
jgi:hypothetical protein